MRHLIVEALGFVGSILFFVVLAMFWIMTP